MLDRPGRLVAHRMPPLPPGQRAGVGSAAVTPMLSSGALPAAVLAMTVLAGLPGLALLALREPPIPLRLPRKTNR